VALRQQLHRHANGLGVRRKDLRANGPYVEVPGGKLVLSPAEVTPFFSIGKSNRLFAADGAMHDEVAVGGGEGDAATGTAYVAHAADTPVDLYITARIR